MRVLRGRVEDPDTDDAIVGRMIGDTASDWTPRLRVWQPPRQCSFGRRDVRAVGYERAAEIAIEHDFPPLERRTGGRAAAFTDRTVAVARVDPTGDVRGGTTDRYDVVVTGVQRALWRLGVPAQRGEPDGAFCPGGPSLQWNGKLAGFAQRVQQDVALVCGIVIVGDRVDIVDVLDPVYDALGVPFDDDAIGSVGRADDGVDVGAAIQSIERALLDGCDPVVERVDQDG